MKKKIKNPYKLKLINDDEELYINVVKDKKTIFRITRSNLPDLTEFNNCCGADEINELSSTFTILKRKYGRFVNDDVDLMEILIISICKFKEYNDTYYAQGVFLIANLVCGTEAEKALTKLSSVIKSTPRKNPLSGRKLRAYIIEVSKFRNK